MSVYYNEPDPYCAEWLRNLIAAGEIPGGDMDERLIQEVTADDVRPYIQAHFFAGTGGWAYAARLAGWPDERPLWTGSCPCQPFSNAGKRLAYSDPRNLWPDFARLIADCEPPIVAGEQVASKAGRLWLAGVRADMEAMGYAVGAADLCAAGIGAPHIRQRLWWVADADQQIQGGRGVQRSDEGAGSLERAARERSAGHSAPGRQPEDAAGSTAEAGGDCGLSDAQGGGREGEYIQGDGEQTQRTAKDGLHNAWSDCLWIPCADGKARRIEPGIEPLVDGFPGRVDQVRAYGNSICPQEAAEFLMAYLEAV